MKQLWTRAWTAFQNLSSRERLLVGSAGGILLFGLFWFGLVMPVLSVSGRISARADAAEQQLGAIERLRREYDEVQGRLASVEGRIRAEERGNLRTTLEALASRSSVKVESMEPQASPTHDRYRETKVEVGLREVTLAQAVSYLHEIERTPQPLSVKALRIRTRQEKPEFLDVTFTVSSFEPL